MEITLDALIQRLQNLSAEGYGELPVYADGEAADVGIKTADFEPESDSRDCDRIVLKGLW